MPKVLLLHLLGQPERNIKLSFALYSSLSFIPTYIYTQPGFVQLILRMAGWFNGGTSMVVEDTMEGFEVNGPIMLAMHPHGTSVGRRMNDCDGQ